MLAAAVPRDFAGLVYDAGAGVGTAGLGAAVFCPGARVGLIESDPSTAAFARANVAANGMEARVAVHGCDLLTSCHAMEKADLVVTNPPFHEPGRVRVSPDARRRAAHVVGPGGIAAWIAACLALLHGRGTLVLIHRADALPMLLQALERRAGAVTLLPVHTRQGNPAKRILLRAKKGSRASLVLLPGLVLNEAEETTRAMARIERGEDAIDW